VSPGIVRVPKLLGPLQELQILHVFQLDQSVHRDVLVDAVLGKAGLEDLEVVDELEFLVSIKLDLVQSNVAYIEELARQGRTIGHRR
jgi:hypothetical protein